MKKKTSNAERSTLWRPENCAYEDAPAYVGGVRDASTPNAERSTSNAQQRPKGKFDLENRLLEFSARIVRLVDALPNTRAANHLAGQLLRSATSPYGNHGEVEAAESRKDFVHKLKICLKELKETRRWLPLAARSEMLPSARMNAVLAETEELIRIFFTSIRTAERNAK